MSLVKDTISNFIGGISQQPDKMIFPNQSKRIINALLNPTYGLSKRPPTEHIKKVINSPLAIHPLIHTVLKEDEKYSVMLTGNGIRVFDFQGNEKAVYLENTTNNYITTNQPLKDLFVETIGDYTFIVNKKVKTALSNELSPDYYPNSALLFLKKGDFATDYKIFVNGICVASYTTEGQKQQSFGVPDGTFNNVTTNGEAIKTTVIMSALYNQLISNLQGWTITINGSSIRLTNPHGGFTIQTEDSNADSGLFCFYKEADDINDLPVSAPNNFILKIIGKGDSTVDDYYVKFQTADGSGWGKGGWQECVCPNIKYKINAETMPHALVRKADGTFSFKVVEWTERQAGDEDSIPTPPFIGNTIQCIFTHKGRLALLSGDKSIYSDTEDIFSFFKSTTLAELDTDPIDCNSNSKMVNLKHVLTYKETLLLFSDTSIFSINGGDVFSNSTVSIDLAMEYSCSKNCSPVGVGNTALFVYENGKHSRVREIYPSQTGINARDITEQIPSYLPAGIYKIAISPVNNIACFLSTEQTEKIYINNFLYNDDEKVQSAWSEWSFNHTKILNIDFDENYLYLFCEYTDGIYFERIDFTAQQTENNLPFLFFIDRKTYINQTTYNAEENKTIINKPYLNTNPLIVLDEKGFPLIITEQTNTNITVKGNYTKVIVGNCYLTLWEMPRIYYRQKNRDGSSKVKEGLLMLKDITLTFNGTGYFKTVITPKYTTSPTGEFVFTGKISGMETAKLEQIPISDDTFLIPVLSSNEDIKSIEIINDSHLPCCFTSLEWLGDLVVRGQE